MELRKGAATFLQNKNIIMFAVTCAFICGVISYYNGIEIQMAFFVTLSVVALTVSKLLPRKFAILAIVMFYLGFFNSALRIKDFDELSLYAPKEMTISGQIVSIPDNNAQVSKFYLRTTEPKGKVLVWVNDKQRRFEGFKVGNHIEITGNLRRPTGVSNPSQFDYARFLQNHGAYSIIYTSAEKCSLIDSKLTPKWLFLQKLNNLRGRILRVHEQYLKSPNLEILGGIVFGDDAVAPPEHIKGSFINSGLLHILAASGMNVAFIWGFWFFFMRKLRVEYKITLISGIFLVILYTLMTGLGASVVRAALMLTFVLVGKLFDRDAHSVSLLSFVALLMLIYNPAYLNDIGFQMSFVATLGILTTGQVLYQRTKEIKLPEAVKGDLTIPIVAQSWVAPTQMFYFNTFAPYSVFANIAIVPFLCVISFGGFISSILAIFYPITKYICLAMDFVINFFLSAVVNISNFFSALPHSLITTQKPAVTGIILYYLLLGVITILIKRGINKRLVTIGITLFVMVCLTFVKIPSHELEIIAFDVQNADCFLVKTPHNDYYVIDTGKFPYTSKNPQAAMIIGKYLKDNGIRKIKALIVTHFDNDHAGGAAYMVENFHISKVYVNTTEGKSSSPSLPASLNREPDATALSNTPLKRLAHVPHREPFSDRNSATAAALFQSLELTATPFEVAENNSLIETDDVQIKLLRSGLDNENENSIQTLITYKDFDVLFTGDAGVKGFEAVKEYLPSDIEVLKVGHHGAKNVTSAEMLQALNPKIALISTGLNRFGHPSKQTLENLRAQDVKTFRTDYDHAMKITTDGHKIKTYTFNAKKRKFLKQL